MSAETRYGARTVAEIQAEGIDVGVLRYARTLDPIAAFERLSGVESDALGRVLQRLDRLQRIADAVAEGGRADVPNAVQTNPGDENY